MNRWKYVLVGLLVGAFAFPLVWNSDPLVIGHTYGTWTNGTWTYALADTP